LFTWKEHLLDTRSLVLGGWDSVLLTAAYSRPISGDISIDRPRRLSHRLWRTDNARRQLEMMTLFVTEAAGIND